MDQETDGRWIEDGMGRLHWTGGGDDVVEEINAAMGDPTINPDEDDDMDRDEQ